MRTLLQTRRGFEITGTVADKEELFIQFEAKDSDLLLLDEDLSRNPVANVIGPLRQIDPCPTVIVLTGRLFKLIDMVLIYRDNQGESQIDTRRYL